MQIIQLQLSHCSLVVLVVIGFVQQYKHSARLIKLDNYHQAEYNYDIEVMFWLQLMLDDGKSMEKQQH